MASFMEFLRRLMFPPGRAPLPEVQEVDWSEWEASVAVWLDSDTVLDISDAQAVHPVAAPVEVDWHTWERAVQESKLR